jgi:hypothetical protein
VGESSHRYFPFHDFLLVESGDGKSAARGVSGPETHDDTRVLGRAACRRDTPVEEKPERQKTKQGINTAHAILSGEMS